MGIRKAIAALGMASSMALVGALAGPGIAQANPQNGLVNIAIEDILTGNQITALQNVPVSVAAVVCGLDVDVLTKALTGGEKVACDAQNTPLTKAFVLWN